MGEGSFSTRRGRFLILSLTVCAVAMIAAVWWYYRRQREAMDAAAVNQLAAIAAGKVAQIANWRGERLGDGRVLAVSPLMRSAQRVLSGGPGTEADRADILAVMKRLSHEFLYTDATLVDMDGSVHLRLNPDHTESAQLRLPSRRELAREAVRANDVVLSDLTLDTRFGRPLMALTIPVRDRGALILEIDPWKFLYPYLQSWPTRTRTAESFLMRFEGPHGILVLSDLRHAPGSALTRRGSYSTAELPDPNQLVSGWSHRTPDYRGVPALKVTRRIPDSPWYLTAKIDESEVEAPLTRLSWEMILIVALIAVANGSGVALIWRNQQLQAYRDREEWFRTVANDTPAYLWMSTVSAENSFINKPLARFFGTDRQDLGFEWVNTIHPEDAERARAQYLESLAARSEYFTEFRVRRFDGEYRWVIAHGVPRFSEKGEFVGYAGSMTDITERREAEASLRAANTGLAHELEERSRAEREIQALTARLIGAQEEERARIARELHDDLSQQIAALSIGMSNLKRKIPQQPEAVAQSERIQQKLVQLAESTRRLSHELHPAVLEHSGLAAALREYCSELTALTGVRVGLETEGCLDGLESAVSLCVFRVVQEALQNVVRHAKEDEARVELRRSDGMLRLRVSDRGAGIDARRGSGLGLVSIKERTQLVNGTVEIQSEPNHGTTLTVTVPVG